MQRSMDLFAACCANFGLTISTAKTVFMHQTPPSAECNAPRINVNVTQRKNVERATTQTTFLRRCHYGCSPTGRFNTTLQGNFEEISEATAYQPGNLEDLAQDRPACRKFVKTGAAIYEANRITTAKTKRAACKAQTLQLKTATAQALPTCPRCQRTFRARIGLVGHL
ncbi:unnamed protein product [Schistocephalus solidus]|uniref:C2H2-type domain-containing protein n=1 Tax=Schistocephalus solidus TaxID=70667 RepID=A0A183SU14_SCHSO|nr:unnamed protein product [Schistocephalus solidus]